MLDAGGADADEDSVLDRVEATESTLLHSEENALKRWILLAGNRGVVSFVLLSVALVSFVVVGAVWTEAFTRLATETSAVETLLVTFLSGTILLVSVVVSINSVVLSQELTDIGSQEENVEEALAFRRGTEELTGRDVSPTRPAEFLLGILRAVRDRAEEFDASVPDDGSAFDRHAATLVGDVVEQVGDVEDRLVEGQFGTSEVLLAGLDYDYTWQLYAVRRFAAEHDDRLTDDQRAVLDELVDALEQFTVGREYFKTLYFERELATLSRWLLVVALPVILYTSFALLVFESGLLPGGTVLGIPAIAVFVAVSYVVSLAPYTLFTTYILRLATIAYRTLAAGPFVVASSGSEGRIDWDEAHDRPSTDG